MKLAFTLIVDADDNATMADVRDLRADLAIAAMRNRVSRELSEVHTTADLGEMTEGEAADIKRGAIRSLSDSLRKGH